MSKGAKIKPYGKPNSKNIKRSSSPKTPGEQKQAIADDIESEIRSYIPVLKMEGAFIKRMLRQVEGVGGPKMKQYKEELESGFENTSQRSKDDEFDKKEAPFIKQVSTDTTAKINVPKPSNDSGKPNSPKKKPSSKK